MSAFAVHLYAADSYERIDDAVSFVGEDSSGSFGLLAHHERFMTVLAFGLARITLEDGSRQFLGFPGGLAYFIDNTLRISTRRYLRDTNVERITEALTRELLEEEAALQLMRRKLERLEAEMLKRLAHIGRGWT